MKHSFEFLVVKVDRRLMPAIHRKTGSIPGQRPNLRASAYIRWRKHFNHRRRHAVAGVEHSTVISREP